MGESSANSSINPCPKLPPLSKMSPKFAHVVKLNTLLGETFLDWIRALHHSEHSLSNRKLLGFTSLILVYCIYYSLVSNNKSMSQESWLPVQAATGKTHLTPSIYTSFPFLSKTRSIQYINRSSTSHESYIQKSAGNGNENITIVLMSNIIYKILHLIMILDTTASLSEHSNDLNKKIHSDK